MKSVNFSPALTEATHVEVAVANPIVSKPSSRRNALALLAGGMAAAVSYPTQAMSRAEQINFHRQELLRLIREDMPESHNELSITIISNWSAHRAMRCRSEMFANAHQVSDAPVNGDRFLFGEHITWRPNRGWDKPMLPKHQLQVGSV